ncbi:MAG: hypothetical protein ACJA13_003577 [Paraglaciecola sp.]|jgi:hypothetical protein
MDKPDSQSAPKDLLRAQKIANMTDTAIKIPFTGIRFGLDSIIGLLPGIGDALMLGASSYIIILAARLGVPKSLRGAMLRNCLIDFALGLIPFAGDIVDVFFQANKKNVRIIEKWWVSNNQGSIKSRTAEKLAQWQAQQD